MFKFVRQFADSSWHMLKKHSRVYILKEEEDPELHETTNNKPKK